MMKHLWVLIFLIGFSCKREQETIKKNSFFDYTTNIKVEKNDSLIKIHSSGKTIQIKTRDLPFQNTICIPTASISYLEMLGLRDKIVGIADPQFIFSPFILRKYEKGEIQNIGTHNELFLERIFLSKPDLVISNSNPALAKFHNQLTNHNIPILLLDEYLEKTPLAKSEILKLFGILYGKEEEANQLFQEIEAEYQLIKEKLKKKSQKPKIIAGNIYGDIWHAPGTKSFQAEYFRDAGAEYIWKNEEQGSFRMSFEEVYSSSEKAEIWMNASDFSSIRALKTSYSNYKWLKPFKNNQIYTWAKRKSKTGANDYFETGIVRSDWVLKDLAAIFHPKEFPNHDLYFYQKL